MRAWFWTLLVLIAAVGVALVLRDHSGNVLILVHPWRIELSLTLAVLLALAAFILTYIGLRAMAWVSAGPDRYRSWRSLRAQRRDYHLLENGWVNILEGRYEQADKDLTRLLGKSRSASSRAVAALASARAAHQLGELTRRDDAMQKARVSARDDLRLKEAVAVVAAEFCLDEQRPEEALMLLQPLQDASPRYFHANRLLLRAYRQLDDADRVYELVRVMRRHGALDDAHARSLIEYAASARLRSAGVDGFKAVWSDLKTNERTLPEVALAAAQVQLAAQRPEEAGRLLEAALDVQLDERLLYAYAQCPPEQVKRRLNKAEGWLKADGEQPALLAVLGQLCLTGELWGQAERYLLRSLRLRDDGRIHALLGQLYDALERPAQANQHWRLAGSRVAALPSVSFLRPLPAADIQSDPVRIDGETEAVDEGEFTGTPPELDSGAGDAAASIASTTDRPS